jgi:hypothetical protein
MRDVSGEEPKERKESFWLLLKEILFLFWDGFGFFGVDDNKLNRLKGIPPRWYDPFFNWRWMIGNVVAVSIVFYVLLTELGEFGHVKSQELGRANEIKYDFIAQEQMGIIGILYLKTVPMLVQLQKW